MSESALAEPPAQTAEETMDAASIASFDQAHAENTNAEQQTETDVVVDTPSKAKAEPAKTGEAKSSSDSSGIPEEILTGAKPEDKTPEKDDEEKEEIPAGLSKKAEANWKLLREGKKTAQLERDAARRELEEFKKATPKVDEAMATKFKAVEQEKTELAERLEKVSFQESPRFQKILKRENQLIESAKETLKGTDFDPQVVDLAAHATGAVRRKILDDAGIEGSARTDVMAYISRLDELGVEKAEALANYKTLSEQERVKTELAQKQARDMRVEQAINSFERKRAEVKSRVTLPDGTIREPLAPFQSSDGSNPKWDEETKTRHNMAEEIFQAVHEQRISDDDLALLSFKAVGYDTLAITLKAKVEELANLKALDKKHKVSQPSAGQQTNGQFRPSNDATGDSPDAQSERAFNEAAARNRNQ